MKDSNLIFLKLRRSERDPDPFRTPGYVVAILTALRRGADAVGLFVDWPMTARVLDLAAYRTTGRIIERVPAMDVRQEFARRVAEWRRWEDALSVMHGDFADTVPSDTGESA